MYKEARHKAGLTQEEAAIRAHIGKRTLQKYEAGECLPPPDVVLALAKEYKQPEMTQRYCRSYCAIGQALAYEVLESVDKSLPGVILKLVTKMKAADAALNRIMYLAIDKETKCDFAPEEWKEFSEAVQVFLDLEHSIEILKEALWVLTDVTELIALHNRKCEQRGYMRAAI